MAHGSGQEHKDSPVHGLLADQSAGQGYMFPGHTDPFALVSRIRLGSESEEIGTGTKTCVQLCGLSVRLSSGKGQAPPGEMGCPDL